ncbi:MAG: P1 family peptidase [Pseudomonadota bacterium]
MELRPGPRNAITDVPGIRLGHAEAPDWGTGTTVVLAETPAIAAAELRGGAPGTRETALLSSDVLIDRVDAVVLSGGSVLGLDAAGGVGDWLRSVGRGLQIRGARVPIVPAAIIFDLPFIADPSHAAGSPYHRLGWEAVERAGQDVALGNVGAGYGATTADLKGGFGTASAVLSAGGYTIGAAVAVNAIGSAVIPGTDRFWAGAFEIDAEFGGLGPPAHYPVATDIPVKDAARAGENTTIAALATDAPLSQRQARRLAVMAQDGFARALYPVHTPFDGDLVFALSTGEGEEVSAPMLIALGAVASTVVARAIARAIWSAEGLGGVPGYRDRRD